MTLFISWFVAEPEEGAKRKFTLKVPWFIPGFIAAAALVTLLPKWIPCTTEVVKAVGGFLKDLSKFLMILTLFLIGANLSREKLKELGLRPVIQGVVLWIVLATLWCLSIHWGWVKAV